MKETKFVMVLISLICFAVNAAYSNDYNIKDFGAVGDGRTLNTRAIQSAIDKCAATGGRVVIPQGTFLSGTIYLKSGVTLYVEKNGILKGSPNFKDYPDNKVSYQNAFTHDANGHSLANKAFIFAEGVQNINIYGGGVIDGSGDSPEFDLGNDNTPASRLRPCMLLIINSKHISVHDLNLRNPAYWLENYLGCSYLELKNLDIYAHTNYNQDGMDVDAQHVKIENCHIDCDDDGICFKSHDANRPVRDVLVRNCVIASNCNAIKFGTMSKGGLQNVNISDCLIHGASADKIRHWQQQLHFIDLPVTVISGIAIESVDGGKVENVRISNIEIHDVQTPIFIVLGNRAAKQVGNSDFYKPDSGHIAHQPAGSISNLTISNVKAVSHSKMSSSITAYPGSYISHVTLQNININGMGEGATAEADIELPEQPGAYPENRMYGQVYPSSGIFIRHVKDVMLDHISLTTRHPDSRPVIVMADVASCKVVGLKTSPPANKAPVVRITDASKVTVIKPFVHLANGQKLIQHHNKPNS